MRAAYQGGAEAPTNQHICVDREASYDYPSLLDGGRKANERRGKQMKKMRKCREVPEKEFIRVWNGSSSAKDAAERMEVGRNAARCRAAMLRRKGRKVRRFKAGRQKAVAA